MKKIWRTLLGALGEQLEDSGKTYPAERLAAKVIHRHYLRPFYKIWDHAVFAEDHSIPVRIFSPKRNGRFPLLIFFHGGGWVTGDIDTYDKICTQMAEITAHVVVSVDYRLAPEYKFPCGLLDCYAVCAEIFAHPQLFGVAADQITLIGDSAGGNLAAAVSLLARDQGLFLPKRQILLYPATYPRHTAHSPFASVRENGSGYLLTNKRVENYMKLYASCAADFQSPYFAPLLADDFSRQPDTLIITAGKDLLRDEAEQYGERLRQAGNRVTVHRAEEALHGFLALNPRFMPLKEAYQQINTFLKGERRA